MINDEWQMINDKKSNSNDEFHVIVCKIVGLMV